LRLTSAVGVTIRPVSPVSIRRVLFFDARLLHIARRHGVGTEANLTNQWIALIAALIRRRRKVAYDAATIANRFIDLAGAQGEYLTPMQLNKLTYIAHGFSLGAYRRPLIDEAVEAWKYGPVIPSLYRQLKGYGGNPVRDKIRTGGWGSGSAISDWDDSIVSQVFQKYGRLSGAQLSYLTHKKDTPWDRMFHPEVMGTRISDDLIGQHYADLLNVRP
jgi:uncharacterized phage-associated protein